MNQNIPYRVKCPCCGYPTLDERGAYDICVLCNWEDDGQDDPYADEVWGGPNADYSLTEARNNYNSSYIMYSEGRDVRLVKGQAEEETNIKKTLVEAFNGMDGTISRDEELWREVLRLEALLDKITNERIEEYEKNMKNKNG